MSFPRRNQLRKQGRPEWHGFKQNLEHFVASRKRYSLKKATSFTQRRPSARPINTLKPGHSRQTLCALTAPLLGMIIASAKTFIPTPEDFPVVGELEPLWIEHVMENEDTNTAMAALVGVPEYLSILKRHDLRGLGGSMIGGLFARCPAFSFDRMLGTETYPHSEMILRKLFLGSFRFSLPPQHCWSMGRRARRSRSITKSGPSCQINPLFPALQSSPTFVALRVMKVKRLLPADRSGQRLFQEPPVKCKFLPIFLK